MKDLSQLPAKIQALGEALESGIMQCIDRDEAKVGLLISGGLDSAIIQALHPLDNIYCITWPEQDNITVAKLASQNKPVKQVTFTREDMIKALPEVARLTGGKGSWSQVCQWFAAKKAAADGVEVLLTGEGADELFGGYSRYRILYWLDRMFQDPRLTAYTGIMKHVMGFSEPASAAMAMLARTRTPKQAEVLLGSLDSSVTSAVGMARLGDLHDSLPPLLDLQSKVVEAHVEHARYPFMTEQVRQAAVTFSEKELVNEIFTKAPLRTVASAIGVHPDIISELTKQGLFIPQDWRPADAQLWSTGWFDKLMQEAASKTKTKKKS